MNRSPTASMSAALSRLKIRAIGFPGPDSGRDIGIDALKGFAILLVIFGHSLEIADRGLFVPNPSFRHHVGTLLYTFHMPLFMFLAGYVMAGKPVRPGKSFLRLVVPFFSWMVVRFLVFTPPSRWGEIGRFTWRGVWLMAEAPLWFLWTLYMCYLLLLVAQLTGRRWRHGEGLTLLALFVLVNLAPTSVLGVPQLQYYFAFFSLGYLAAKHKDRILGVKPAVRTAALVLAPAAWLGLFFAVYYRLGEVMAPVPAREVFSIPALALERYGLALLGILASFALLAAVRAARARRVEASFGWLGLATMDLYVTHGILIHASSGAGWVKVFSAFFLGLAGGLALAYAVLRPWRLLSYPFLGRSYRDGPRYRLELSPVTGGAVPEADASRDPGGIATDDRL